MLLLSTAACGDDDDSASVSTTTSTAAGTTPDAASASISIVDFSFAPDDLEVAAGASVGISNDDSAAHTMTADDGSFDTGELAPGDTATVTVEKTTTYHCEIHDYMHGTLSVA